MTEDSSIRHKNNIVIHNDDQEQFLTKSIWALLARSEIHINNTRTRAMLEEHAPDAVLILIRIGDDEQETGKACEMAAELSHNPKVVADIIGVTREAGIDRRLELHSYGFDAIFNLDFLENEAFHRVLENKLYRGLLRRESHDEQEEYRLFQAALAASPDAFIVFDENRRLFFASEHYKRAYAQSAHKLVRGIDVMEAFELLSFEDGVTRGDERYEKMRDFWAKLEGEQEFTLDSGRRWRIKAAQLEDGQGTIVTTTDITSYYRQQADLSAKSDEIAEALRKEQEASAIQKQFINMISHEFRTPLSIIDGNAQIIQRRLPSLGKKEVISRVSTIRSAVSRLIGMMEGVLSSNMLQTGKLTINREPCDLRKIIIDICKEHEVLSNNLTIRCQVEELPETVQLDKKVIMLILGNLLSNAVKFSPEEPLIKVRAWSEPQGIKVRVEDNGIGIPEQEVERIFERYYRATTSSGIPGTGLGLSLVKELVELHGGTVNLKSEQGAGTKVVFFIPFGL